MQQKLILNIKIWMVFLSKRNILTESKIGLNMRIRFKNRGQWWQKWFFIKLWLINISSTAYNFKSQIEIIL